MISIYLILNQIIPKFVVFVLLAFSPAFLPLEPMGHTDLLGPGTGAATKLIAREIACDSFPFFQSIANK